MASSIDKSSADTRPGPKREKLSGENSKTKEKKTYDDPLLSMFAGFRDEIDDNNDRRERLIKTSRDVTSLSKKLIFLLHRFKPSSSDPQTDSVLIEAKKKIEEIVNLLKDVAKKEGLELPTNLETFEEKKNTQTEVEIESRTGEKRKRNEGQLEDKSGEENGRFWKYERNVGPGIEEFIEAVTFYHFLSSGSLITHSEIQSLFEEDQEKVEETSGEDQRNASTPSNNLAVSLSTSLWIPASRYVLGCSDLSGEIMRFSTNNAGAQMNGKDVITVCLDFLRTLSNGLGQFTFSVQDMAKKQAVTEQSLRKIEVLASTIKIRSSEFKDQDPEVVKEMIKRALNSGGDENE